MEVILDNRRNEPNLKLINMEQVEIEKIDSEEAIVLERGGGEGGE